MNFNNLGGNQLVELAKQIVPQNRKECILFLAFILFYFSYSVLLALNSNIVDYPGGWDLYFSFDSPFYYNHGSLGPGKHPLVAKFTMILMYVGELFKSVWGLKAKTIASVVFCSSLISLSVVYVFRYLRMIIQINNGAAYLLSIFFGLFSTNMILCFTTESYTFSALLIPLTVYFFSYNIKLGQDVKLLPSGILAIFLGGTTITNLSKIGIPMLFTKAEFSTRILRIVCIGILFIGIMAWLEYKHGIVEGLLFNYVAFSNDEFIEGSFFHKAVDYFLASPIFLPEVIWNTDKTIAEHNIMGAIDIAYFDQWWQYAFTSILYLLVALSIVKQCRNKLVWMLACLFGIDIFLHIVLKFGTGEGFIYGAHWICVVPLLIGWLYQSIGGKYKPFLLGMMGVLTVSLLVNNVCQITNFIK